MERMKRRLYIVLSILLFIGILVIALVFRGALYKNLNPTSENILLYIDLDDTPDSVCKKIEGGWGFDLLSQHSKYTPKTGRYLITPSTKLRPFFHKLILGEQDPIMLTIPSVRTMERLAGVLGKKLMLDSLCFVQCFQDSAFVAKYGYNKQTLPAFFIPNTYQVYWNMNPQDLMFRMQKENARFWNKERLKKSELLNMNAIQVATLASIVDEETANNAEKPMIAGLYLNRLRLGMLLQADPTVKFATGDFSLRRILNIHLKTESPYNTYLHKGLPPGPIRIPSIAGIDAVLNHVKHPYLYMCAKEDFSGTHNFARNLGEHMRNARKYQNALNKRKIK